MQKREKIFIGVAWPYANGEQHIGHMSGAYLPPDIFARFHRMFGSDVLMVSGSDSHGTPITVKADEEHTTPDKILERYHEHFIKTYQRFGLTFDLFTHTDTQMHWDTAHELFQSHLKNGYLYTESQKQIFDASVGKFLPDRYVEGTCPKCGFTEARGDQCDQCGSTYEAVELKNPRSKMTGSSALEVRDTVHYFLDLGKLNDGLIEWINDGKKSHWRAQVINYAKAQINAKELRGRPITRDLLWGVSVPVDGFDSKRLYVWYEAVIGYLSATKEWALLQGDSSSWDSWWKTSETNTSDVKSYYFIGKDNVVFHTIMWPAMLLGLGKSYVMPFDVPANEYLNMYGRKFSKSRGNIISISAVLDRFQPDAWRYALTAMAPESTDVDFTWDDFVERVNNELVANWGNLVNRLLGFSHKRFGEAVPDIDLNSLDEGSKELLEKVKNGFSEVTSLYRAVKLKSALETVRACSQLVNQYISDRAPWTLIKTDEAGAKMAVYVGLQCIDWLKVMWAPILPFSCQKLHELLGFQGELFGRLYEQRVDDARGEHLVLRYDHFEAKGRWALGILPPGQKIPVPEPLFQKLDPKSIPELNHESN